MFHGCSKGGSGVFQCFMGISRMFYGYFFNVSGVFAYVEWMFDECFNSVSSVQVISVDIFWVFKSVLMLF